MSDIFKDIRALKLRESDAWKPSSPITYGEIKDNYSFTGFVKIDEESEREDNNSLKPIDWLFESMLQDAKNAPLKYIIKKTTKRFDKGFYISDDERRSNYIHQLKSPSRGKNSHQFQRPIKGDIRTAMKRALREKEDIYQKLCTQYDQIKTKEKNVALFPLRLTLERSVFFDGEENKYQLTYPQLRKAISSLAKTFSELIKRIGKRAAYMHMVWFDRLVLLNNDMTPYLHVNFYFKNNDFSDYYLRDIVREWCILTEKNCRIDYTLFQDNLPEMPEEDDKMMEEDWHDRCVYDEAKDIEYHFELHYRNAIIPFAQKNSELGYAELISELTRIKSRYADQPERVNKLTDEIKNIKKINHSQEYHKAYLLSVAKQFIKVPNVNHFSAGKVHYSSSKDKNKPIEEEIK